MLLKLCCDIFKMVIDMDYYKAYDKRYKQVHDKNTLWFSFIPTLEVMDVINKYDISKDSKILEVGCGEGRDAIYLLSQGYNVLGVDSSKEAIKKCNELSNYLYKDKFKEFDIINAKLAEKFDFIYSISVLSTLIDDYHRRMFLKFIKEHLTDRGYACITVIGDGEERYSSDKDLAFDDIKKINVNTNEEMDIASTSCRIVDWDSFLKEITECGLKVKDKWVSDRIPDFSLSMCVVVGK